MGKYDLNPKVTSEYGTTPLEPAVEMLKVRPSFNWGPVNTLLIIGVLAYVVMREPSAPVPPGPTPPPTPNVVITEDVEKITVEAEKRFIKNKAEAAERLAADMDAGKITNSNHFGKMAIEYQDAIERDAFAKMIELNQKYVRESGESGWSPEQIKAIKELQRRKAKGYRELLK